jgi:hypothetical protein
MAGASRTVECHGLTLALAEGWNDDSIFRFAAPVRETPPGVPPFRSSMVVARRPANPTLTAAEALQGLRSGAPPKVAEATFKVRGGQLAKAEEPAVDAPPAQLGSGLATIGGREAAWLDRSFFSPEAHRRLYQRQIIALSTPGTVVLLTLTSDLPDLDVFARQFGFAAKG